MNAHFAPSNSNINSYARAATTNNFATQGYYFLLSNLADILTKREYLYRELFFIKNKIINLDSIFLNTPKNALFFDIKTALNFVTIDKTFLQKTYSRDASHFAFVKFANQYLQTLHNLTPSNILNNGITKYIQTLTDTTYTQTTELYKNQYRPMRKGVSNMIRLHATGAIALPIEIRLQVLASSKDVIHS